MKVIVRTPIHATGVYHTTECKNCERIQNRREITKEKAEQVGLHECVHCTKNYGQKKDQKKAYYRLLRDSNSVEELKENVNASSIGE